MTAVLPDLQTAMARMSNPTVSVADYAAIVGLSVDVIYEAVHRDEIPVIRHGQRFRIPSAWVRQQLRLPDDSPAA